MREWERLCAVVAPAQAMLAAETYLDATQLATPMSPYSLTHLSQHAARSLHA